MVDDSFHSDPIVTDKPGNMGWRMIRVKIEVDRKDSERKEECGDDPESPSGLFQDHQQDPETEERQKGKVQISRERRKVKMANVNPEGVGNENRNERKTEYPTHSGP
jgi:hypothetical protein